MTIARYYTPSGRSIQAKGVEPDIVVPHRIIEAAKSDQQRLFKEKDLANHLNAEPGPTNGNNPDPKKTDSKQKPKNPPGLSPLDAKQLLTDSQVRRALDILISYDVFKKLGNG